MKRAPVDPPVTPREVLVVEDRMVEAFMAAILRTGLTHGLPAGLTETSIRLVNCFTISSTPKRC